jgi:hypothetical protein
MDMGSGHRPPGRGHDRRTGGGVDSGATSTTAMEET